MLWSTRALATAAHSYVFLVQNVKIDQEVPLVIAEEAAILRVGCVGVHVQCIEVVRKVQQRP